MRKNTLHMLTWVCIAFFFLGFSPLRSADEPACVKIVAERVERVGRDEVRFRLKVVNQSDAPVFMTGIRYEKPTPYPLFLEQWRAEKGWRVVAPCMDLPPPEVISLNRNETMALDFVLTLPLPSTCKERSIQLEGRFRYRLEYFESEDEARVYVKQTYSPSHQLGSAAVAVSAPFEIPPATPQRRSE